MTIREARTDEAAAVVALWREAGSSPSVTDSVEHVARVVGSDHAWLLVSEHGGRLTGSVIAGWDGWRANVYRLAVRPELRRQGIADRSPTRRGGAARRGRRHSDPRDRPPGSPRCSRLLGELGVRAAGW